MLEVAPGCLMHLDFASDYSSTTDDSVTSEDIGPDRSDTPDGNFDLSDHRRQNDIGGE